MSNATYDREDLARRVLDALCHRTSLEDQLVDSISLLGNLGEFLKDYAVAVDSGAHLELYAPLIASFGRSLRMHTAVAGCIAETLQRQRDEDLMREAQAEMPVKATRKGRVEPEA